jgi:hypothetical protein
MSRTRLLALSLLPTLLAAGSAFALDLTGTWQGKETCLRLNDDDNVEAKLKGEATLEITQSGSDLNVKFLGDFLVASMNGAALAYADNPNSGRAGMYRCGTSTTISMTTSFKAKSSASGTGTLDGTANVVGHGTGNTIATCKYSLKRVSAVNPNVPPCP